MNKEYLLNKLDLPLQSALFDGAVTEISRNVNGQVWLQKNGESILLPEKFSDTPAYSFVQAVTHAADLYLNEANPSVVCSLPFNNERISIAIAPIVKGLAFNIRKPCLKIQTLESYATSGVMTHSQAEYLKEAIQSRKNILVSGSPGSGKTTLANALLKSISETQPQGYRIVILEDTSELQCNVANHLSLKTSKMRSMRDLVQYALRAAPDAIVVGEVVDGAVLDLLKAWNTGCPGGLATIHANSAFSSLMRLEDLAQEVSVTAPKQLIGEAVDVIIHLAADRHHPAKRTVTDVLEIITYQKSQDNYQFLNID